MPCCSANVAAGPRSRISTPPAVLPDHLDVPPFGTPVRRTEHLQRGFLRGEARGESFGAAARFRAAVGDLGVRVDTLEIAATEPLDGRLDIADIHDVRSETQCWFGHEGERGGKARNSGEIATRQSRPAPCRCLESRAASTSLQVGAATPFYRVAWQFTRKRRVRGSLAAMSWRCTTN